MATDLTKVPDHPATLLRALASRQSSYSIGVGYRNAADDLEREERERDVTFAALDNDALARVRDAYATTEATDWRTVDHEAAIDDLLNAVRDLLGLGEG